MAPRRELLISYNPEKAFIGQTLRFTYGMSPTYITMTVKGYHGRVLEGTIVCGPKRGSHEVYEIVEMLDCKEIFGSTVLHHLLSQVKDATWSCGKNSKTRSDPRRKPRLNPDFNVPADIKHKRK